VGEKTAAKLLNDYGSLDGVFANLEKCTPKLRQSLGDSEQMVRKNVLLTPLVRDVPLDVAIEDLRMGDWDRDATRQLFNFLEFRTLWDRLIEAVGDNSAAASGPTPTVEAAVSRPEDPHVAVADIEALGAHPALAVEAAWEGAPARSLLTGLALSPAAAPAPGATGDGSAAKRAAGAGPAGQPTASGHVLWLSIEMLARPAVRDALEALLRTRPVIAHRAKELMRGLMEMGIEVGALAMDTAVASYLLDPADTQYLLEDITLRYAQMEVAPPGAAPAGQLDLAGDGIDPAEAAAVRAVAVAAVAVPLGVALDAQGLRLLHDEIETPLVRVLARMEVAGVRVDADYLRELSTGLNQACQRLEASIHDLAGESFNVNSTPQLRTVLFEKLGLSPLKRTKTGFSTDAQSLERLRGQHPIIDTLLQYREVEKLRSTYGEGLLNEVGPDGRIHATFNQTVARTGRLSSDQPNLHNIPVRSEEGRRFRRAFIPSDGFRFLVADYNQIELRVIAHLSLDPGLVAAFTEGLDIHRATAARIFKVDPQKVDIGQRSKAKMVSYGLAYGMEAFGLAQRLGVPVSEATVILDAYFDGFPSVRSYMDATVAEARKKGYTETIFGRRRQIPELASGNPRVRQAGERQAMNAGIQGLAADIFKVALVRLDNGLESAGMRSRLILQVHDEVILEVPPEEEDQAAKLTVDAMTNAADLTVPLVAEVSWGASWADAKG